MKEVMKLWYVNYFLFLFFEDDIFGLLYKEYILFFVDQVLFESRYVFSYGYIFVNVELE